MTGTVPKKSIDPFFASKSIPLLEYLEEALRNEDMEMLDQFPAWMI